MGEIKQTYIADYFFKSRLAAKMIQETRIKKNMYSNVD